MRIELHCHSTCSDGSEAPQNVAEMAQRRGVHLFSLTDHDTCEGHAACLAAVPEAIRGVELSCVEGGRTVHLLLYDRDASSRWGLLEGALETQRQVRRERLFVIAERLGNLGAPFDPEALLKTRQGSVGRPHVAEELVRLGHVTSRDEAFQRYLKDGGPGDVPVERLSLGEGLELARASGAASSLAHPHTLGRQAQAVVEAHASGGLEGLEVYYGLYTAKKRKQWAALADRHDLVPTAGSDFHGAGLPQVRAPGVDVPDEIGMRIFSWLHRSLAAD